MKLLKADDLSEALKPLWLFSTLVGLHPAAESQCNKLGLFWGLSLMISSTIYSIYSVTSNKVLQLQGLVANIGDNLEIYLALINSTATFLTIISMRSQLALLVEQLAKFDKCLQIPLSEDYRRIKFCTIFGILLAFLPTLAFITVDVNLFLTEVTVIYIGSEVVAYSYPIIILTVMVLQFCTIVLLIKQRFYWINAKLSKYPNHIRKQSSLLHIPSAGMKFKSITRLYSESQNILETLRLRHGDLCEISRSLNRIYSIPILMTALYMLVTITLTLFFSFKSSSSAKERSPLLYAVYYILSGLIHCGQLLALVMASSQTMREARSTSQVLHSIRDNAETNYIMHFSLQLLQDNVEFSGCGIFILNETLLFHIVGAITTYLVIVVQFQLGFVP